MALTYGFFNSVNGDRKYNADQMSEMFDGLICDGVYQNVGEAMQVVASTGLTVNVSTGRARINSQWAKVDTAHPITLNGSHVTLNRYTAICLRVDFANRKIELIARDGENATTPTKPEIVRNSYYYELILAYIYVGAGATTLTQANIEDTRANTALCGIVSSLVQQLDTQTLYDQYTAAYNEQLEKMNAWFTAQRNAFDTWFNDLTETLNVDTYITNATENYTTTSASGERYIDIPLTLNYTTDDLLLVFINGVNLAQGVDYEIQLNEVTGGYMAVLPNKVAAGNVFTFTVVKSQIGVRA
jgi:hypothetical protein